MFVSDRTNYERILLNTPGTNSNRWPESYLIPMVDRATKAIVARIRFPDSRINCVVATSFQEYQLPETHRIHRVYLNGQICVETPGNVDTLEGDQILVSDQTATGAVPLGTGAAQGGTASLPQWAVQTPTTYPYLNSWGTPAPMSQPWIVGSRPRYYRRGGYIGFVPAPAFGTVITIDCMLVPPTLIADSQQIVVPDNFADAIDAYVMNRALMSDRDPAAHALAKDWLSTLEGELRLLRTWKRDYSLEDTQIIPISERGFYRIGGHQTGQYE